VDGDLGGFGRGGRQCVVRHPKPAKDLEPTITDRARNGARHCVRQIVMRSGRMIDAVLAASRCSTFQAAEAALKPGRNEASFAEGLKGLVPHIQGWASEKLVSPVGPLWELGTIREAGGSDVADLLYAIFPIGRPPGGAAMPPVPVGPAAGSWTRI
jgi:hypothetical protein